MLYGKKNLENPADHIVGEMVAGVNHRDAGIVSRRQTLYEHTVSVSPVWRHHSGGYCDETSPGIVHVGRHGKWLCGLYYRVGGNPQEKGEIGLRVCLKPGWRVMGVILD